MNRESEGCFAGIFVDLAPGAVLQVSHKNIPVGDRKNNLRKDSKRKEPFDRRARVGLGPERLPRIFLSGLKDLLPGRDQELGDIERMGSEAGEGSARQGRLNGSLPLRRRRDLEPQNAKER